MLQPKPHEAPWPQVSCLPGFLGIHSEKLERPRVRRPNMVTVNCESPDASRTQLPLGVPSVRGFPVAPAVARSSPRLSREEPDGPSALPPLAVCTPQGFGTDQSASPGARATPGSALGLQRGQCRTSNSPASPLLPRQRGRVCRPQKPGHLGLQSLTAGVTSAEDVRDGERGAGGGQTARGGLGSGAGKRGRKERPRRINLT